MKKIQYKRTLVISLILLLISIILITIKTFFIDLFYVPSSSMVPTLRTGDFVLVNKFIKKEDYNRGDLIVFRNPSDNSLYVKRLIALPNENIMILGGKIWIDGKEIEEDLGQNRDLSLWGAEFTDQKDALKMLPNGATYRIVEHNEYHTQAWKLSGVWETKDNEIFVLGDWRGFSTDSRDWGPINREYMVGRVICLKDGGGNEHLPMPERNGCNIK